MIPFYEMSSLDTWYLKDFFSALGVGEGGDQDEGRQCLIFLFAGTL